MAKITMAGSYVALITPFTESDEVDYAKIEELVEWHVAEGYELCFLSFGVCRHTSVIWPS
jgi:dihydrodipicolinate synthase/N-acetylneuraminate lyase